MKTKNFKQILILLLPENVIAIRKLLFALLLARVATEGFEVICYAPRFESMGRACASVEGVAVTTKGEGFFSYASQGCLQAFTNFQPPKSREDDLALIVKLATGAEVYVC